MAASAASKRRRTSSTTATFSALGLSNATHLFLGPATRRGTQPSGEEEEPGLVWRGASPFSASGRRTGCLRLDSRLSSPAGDRPIVAASARALGRVHSVPYWGRNCTLGIGSQPDR